MSSKAQSIRKIRTFIKKVNGLHEVQTMLSLIDNPSDHMKFLISDDNIDEYIENSLLLKEHGTLCFKDFSRLRGKKEDSSIALSQFLELYSSEFPDVVDEQQNENKSKGRSKRKSIDGDGISNEHLIALKSIIKQVMKHELAEPFLYPVDSKVFPEYYEVIDSPMDLTTALEKLPEFKSVEQALENLNQIWENCRKFNQENAPIIESADTLSNLVDDLVASKLSDFSSAGKSAANSKSVKRKKAPISLSKAAMNKIVQDLKLLPCAAPFIDPVDLDQAPGYFDYVQTMMDLSTIETKIKNNYTSSKQLRNDIQLIVSNCEAYNHEDSDIVVMAHEFNEKFEELLSAAENATSADDEPPVLVIKKSKLSSSLTKPKGGLVLPQQTMLKIVQDLKSLPCSIYFILPVNFDEAPGYKELIAHPMDLSTIEKNVKMGEYSDSEGFKDDVKHIWMNCQIYNHESSDIYQMATTFKTKSEEMIRVAEESIKEKHPKANDDSEPKKGRSKVEESSRVKAEDNVPDASDENLTKDMYSFDNLKNWKQSKLDQLLEQLKKSTAATTEACRYRCAQRAREIKHNARSGFYDKNGVYYVFKLGKIPSINGDVIQGYNSSHHIYPHGYKCNVFLRLCLVPQNNEPLELDITENTTPFVDIEFSNNVMGSVGTIKDKPVFAVSFDSGVLVEEGQSGRECWDQIITGSKSLDFFKVLGGKLHRCRSVFNRICCHPDITPFLEQIPYSGNIGNEYYETIKSPMWLREIHNRLKEGVYDCESYFAWDMRLIFQNCMEFNKPNSELYKNAQHILLDFEQLFCFWVHSIQDSNIGDHAKGEFEDWQYLRYFDAADPNHHFCRESNKSLPESDLIMCVICEDEYKLSVAGIEKKTAEAKKTYKCNRCSVMEDLLPFGFADIPAMSEKMKPYSKEELATGFQWIPSQDEKLSAGWAQAKAIKQHRPTNRFLSPLGNEFPKRDEALKSVADEKKMHESLLAARAIEFQESMNGKNKSVSSPRRARRSRNKEQDADNEESSNNAPTAVSNEEGRIIFGKIYDYVVPEGYTFAWYVRSLAWPDPKAQDPANAATRLVKVNESMLGQSGFFGLHNEDIKRSIESLEKSELCLKYQFKDADIVVQDLLKEISLIKDSKNQKQDYESKVKSILASQKWYWEIVEKNLRKKWGELRNHANEQNNQYITDTYMARGFKTLFTNNKQGEMLLAVWDFLDSISSFVGENPFSFSDLLESLEKSGAICTYGQVLFDDVCCHLTNMLIQEFKQTIFLKKEAKWLKFSLYNPLNVISWPLVAQTALFYLTRPVGSVESIVDTANIANDHDSLLRKQIITLVAAHPSCPHVGDASKLVDIRSKVADSSFDSTSKFIEELDKYFDDAMKQHYPDSKEHGLANEMYKWFCQLLERLGVQGPRSNDQEMEINPTIPVIDPEHPSKASDNYLNPFDFGNLISTDEGASGNFKVRMLALDALEKTMTLLRSSDPESWDADGKCAILSTLVDYGSQTEIFNNIKKNVVLAPNNYTEINDIPPGAAPDVPQDYEFFQTLDSNEVCYFSGLSIKLAPSDSQWVYVPQELLEKNDMNAVMHPDGPPVVSGRPVCILSVCNRIFAAREITAGKRRKYDEFLTRILDDLERDHLSLSLGKSTLGRAVPVGQDSNGSQYWLLESQARSSLHVGDSPCILVRNITGWWGYYNARQFAPMLDSLSVDISIERVLKETIIIRLYRAKYDFTVLRNASDGGYGSIYEQWIQRYKKLLDRARTLTVPTDVDTMEIARSVSMVEHFWHTFAEVRATLYHGILQRKMDDDSKHSAGETIKNIEKRRKKMRDSWPEDTFDCHPVKGFFRNDGFQSIRNVSCTLMATRIMADPYVLLLYIAMNQRSRVRELLDDNNERVQERLQELLAEKAEEGLEEQAEGEEENADVDVMDVDYQSHINTTPTIISNAQASKQIITMAQRVVLEPVQPRLSLGSSGSVIQKNKAVEQLHITSGEVLRIYPRGKDASTEMGISHSGISLCCSGKQEDFCGFKWRFYTGPAMTFEDIEHLQTPMEDLLNMKISRNKSREIQPTVHHESRQMNLTNQIENFNENEIPVSSVTPLYSYRPNYPSYLADKDRESKEEITLSTVLVSGRILKIKSEMINLLYILPERKLKFADEDNENEEKQNEEDAEDQDEVDEEKLRKEKADRKKQRRERRAQGLTRLTTRIQNAATVSELYKVMIYLENSFLTSADVFDFDNSMFPNDTNLSSILAARLFTFDRCLRYDTHDLIDKLSRPDTAHQSKKFRNKLQYVPKCYISPNCNLSMAHYQLSGCNGSCSGSRICENVKETRPAPPTEWRTSFVSSNVSMKSKARARTYDDESEENAEEDEEEEFWDSPNGRKSKKRRLEDDIETVTPLVPPKYLWKTTVWL